MKIQIELSEKEKMDILQSVTRQTAMIAKKEITKYFKNISQNDFATLLRRAMRTSCDAFFQHFMQHYIEQRSKNLFKKINKDIIDKYCEERGAN